MHSAISLNKTEIQDTVLSDFSEVVYMYFSRFFCDMLYFIFLWLLVVITCEAYHCNCFSYQGYYGLSSEDRCKLLMVLGKDYDLNRTHVHDLMKQYLGLQLPAGWSIDFVHNDFWCICYCQVKRSY